MSNNKETTGTPNSLSRELISEDSHELSAFSVISYQLSVLSFEF